MEDFAAFATDFQEYVSRFSDYDIQSIIMRCDDDYFLDNVKQSLCHIETSGSDISIAYFLQSFIAQLRTYMAREEDHSADNLQCFIAHVTSSIFSFFNVVHHEENRLQSVGGQVFKAIFQLLLTTKEIGDAGKLLAETVLDILERRLLNGLASTIFFRKEQFRVTYLGDPTSIPLDDTTGWRHLEAYLFVIYSLILTQLDFGVFPIILKPIPLSILEEIDKNSTSAEKIANMSDLLILYTSQHVNRHLREMTCRFIEQLFITQNVISSDTRNLFTFDSNFYVHPRTAKLNNFCRLFSNSPISVLTSSNLLDSIIVALSSGLEDEWSQIRLVATTASRALILAVADGPKEESEAKQGVLIRLWTPLLPRLCMNRFYAADAVRLASLSLWKDVMTVRFDGKQLLAERCEEAVAYYIRSSRTSTNHMVCEAACHAMGEIASRLEKSVIEPNIPEIVQELGCRLTDDRWPVKDAACCAIGAVVVSFPDICVDLNMNNLVKLFERQLIDCIPSVRENAAVAIGKFIRCRNNLLSKKAREMAESFIRKNLLLLQSISSVRPAEGMVVGTDGQAVRSFLPVSMISRAAADIRTPWEENGRAKWSCCIDCMELRNSVDWELSQAAVLLVRELSLLSTSESDLQSFQSLVKQVFHYSDILNESTLRAHESEGSFSFLDGLWLILLHRIQPVTSSGMTVPVPQSAVAGNEGEKRNRYSTVDTATRNRIRNLEKLQSALYSELPSIIFGLLRGDLIDSVEALVGWKDDRERDLILLRQINFSRCVDAFRSDMRDFKAMSSLKQAALEEVSKKMGPFFSPEISFELI